MGAEKEIIVQNLTKDYPRIRAVDDVSFGVGRNEIFGLLGPNGAGKTTTIRLLLTLIRPTAGKIRIMGVDALSRPQKIRQISGYVPQDVSVDGELTGYENILMYAKLYGLSRRGRRQAIDEILGLLELGERACDLVNTYSGGMMRRLEIAQALVNRPRLLFLDEPSIGLDPGAKRVIWGLIRKLRSEFGTIVFINTHDMNEADELCDRIGILNKGRLVTVGSPAELKATVGGDVLSLDSNSPRFVEYVRALGYSPLSGSPAGHADILVSEGEHLIPRVLASLKARGVEVESVSLKKPSLDDVFLKYTGTRIEAGDSWKEARRTRRTFRRMIR
jgi:ABC-2 type transport system ATP-binding protein